MNVVVEGIYEKGIVKLKSKVKAPNKSEVLVLFKTKTDKQRFMKSAGSWKDIDTEFFSDILNSRVDLRERKINL